jgi:16S rRNA (guanine966-N2)-methyltransferase
VRVVAGSLRGRKIDAPRGKNTRPTTDKARQATFNALGSMGVIDGAVVVDVFAGSGAMGIEALSRGAARCTFIESDREALAVLEANVDHLGLRDRSVVVRGDALSRLDAITDATLAIIDPPYEFRQWAQLLERVHADVVVAESDRELDAEVPPIAGWEAIRVKRYGRAFVTFFQRLA